MSYYFSKTIQNCEIQEVREKVSEALKAEGFGIITEIDVKKTFKEKIDIDFKDYLILGACNPVFAHKAISEEDKIGLFLPCNVVLNQVNSTDIEVSVIDPLAAMSNVDNPDLEDFALHVRKSMENVINSLNP